jgi:hypothetical protein
MQGLHGTSLMCAATIQDSLALGLAAALPVL